MLTVFLIVFPALLTPCELFGTGKAVVGAGDGGGPGYTFADGARSPLLGVPGMLLGVAKLPVLFRVFAIGKAGRELVGGPFEARGLGNVVAIMTDVPGVYQAQDARNDSSTVSRSSTSPRKPTRYHHDSGPRNSKYNKSRSRD